MPSPQPKNATNTPAARPANGKKIPDIPWREDNGKLIWSLLAEIEKPLNRHVFLGKADKKDNTKGDSKAKVCKRIAEAILPELFHMSPTVMGDRIKSKVDALLKDYKKHAQRLRVTGGGIENAKDENDDDLAGDAVSAETLPFYIYGQGPDDSTPPFARNLWDAILTEFPYFSTLHRMFGARPNVVPIVVMTGVGPTGPQTVWYQQPDDSMIDPTLLALSPPATPGPRVTTDDDDANTTNVTTNGIAPPSPSPRSFGSNLSNTPQTPAPASSRAPKLSSASHLALAKAAAVKLVPQKRSVAEAMIDISQRTFDALERKNVMEQATAQRAQVLAEYQAGLLTKEEWLEEVQRIKKLFSPPSPPPAKRVRTHDEFVDEDA